MSCKNCRRIFDSVVCTCGWVVMNSKGTAYYKDKSKKSVKCKGCGREYPTQQVLYCRHNGVKLT